MKQNIQTSILGLVTSILVFSSCTKTDYLDIDAADRPPLASKQSFVNARGSSADLVFWNFTSKLTAAVAPNTSSAYADGSFGSVQINVTEGNSSSYLVSRLFGNSTSFSATGGPNGPIATYYHSIFAAKTINGQRDSLILFYDNLEAPAAGKAKLRFVHLATGLPAVNFQYVNGTAENVFSNVTYGAAGDQVLTGEGLNAWSLGPFSGERQWICLRINSLRKWHPHRYSGK